MTYRHPLLAGLFALGLIVFSCTDDKVDPNACDTLEVTYTDGAADIFNGSCAVSGCHISGNQAPLLEDFSSASNASMSPNLLGTINHEAGFPEMPPGGKLDQCEIDIITAWIANGSPE